MLNLSLNQFPTFTSVVQEELIPIHAASFRVEVLIPKEKWLGYKFLCLPPAPGWSV